jgi:hypothetical protein
MHFIYFGVVRIISSTSKSFLMVVPPVKENAVPDSAITENF